MPEASTARQTAPTSRRRVTDKLEDHPIASIFPKMDSDDYASLIEDLRAHGLHTPVVLYADKILDGRNRYEACRDADVECQFETYNGNDPVGYAVSLNLKRRHLSPSQRALVADRLSNLKQGQKKTNTAIAVSQDDAAKILKISIDSIQRARKVQTLGAPELIEAVEEGKLAVSTAADIADLPLKEQQRYLRGRKEQWQTADIFEGLAFQGSAAANAQFDDIIQAAIAAIQELNKIIADAIWDLKGFDRRKLKGGRKKYTREIAKLPQRVKRLLAGDQVKARKAGSTPRGNRAAA